MTRLQGLRRIGVPLAIIAVAVLGAGYLKATKPELEPEAPRERVWTVATVPATRVAVQPEMTLFGEIVAGREIELRPLVEGRIVDVGDDFLEGGVVRAGDLLVAIDPFEYRAAVAEFDARVAEAEARLAELAAELNSAGALLEHDRQQMTLAVRQYDRRKRLQGTAAASQKALDDAQMAVSQQEQRVIQRHEIIDRLSAQAEQQEAVMRRWEVSLRRARRDLRETHLEAPFGGFLVDVDAAAGKRVGVNDRIARLIDADRLEARFNLSDAEFARLLAAGGYVGRAATVVWRIGAQAFTFEATIERVESEIDAASGGIDLFARVHDAGVEGVLRPGAFVEVLVADQRYDDVIRLPESALHDGTTVYVVAGDRLEAHRVEVVVRNGREVLLRGALASDARVVTTRFPEIGVGVRVRVQ